MKALLRTMQKFKPAFEEGKPLARFKGAYDAAETFFFAPAHPTSGAPHIRDPLDVKRFMSMVIVALAPATVLSVYFFGLRALALILVSYAVGGTVELVFSVVRKEEINEGFLVTGLIFPLTLPPALPLWMAGVGVAVGVIVGKELFGGTGRNVFNPALVGRCFLMIGYPIAMSTNTWIAPGGGALGRLTQYAHAGVPDAMSGATPLALAQAGEFVPVSNLIFGNVSGSLGETSAAAVILGGVFLIVTRVVNWRTIVGTLGAFALLGAVLGQAAPDTFAPVGWHLFAGGLLFGAFFMATDPITGPGTNAGKWLYGGLVGTVTLLLRHLSGFVEGAMFAILLGNIAAPVLDELVVKARLRSLSNEG